MTTPSKSHALLLALAISAAGCATLGSPPPGPNLVETVDGWTPAPGYTWLYPGDPSNYEVVPISSEPAYEPTYQPTYEPDPPTYEPPVAAEPEPSPFQQEYAPELTEPEVLIQNSTVETITVTIHGPIYRQFVLPPWGSDSAIIPPGSYSYEGTCPGVLPASGVANFESYYRYTWEFSIVTTYE